MRPLAWLSIILGAAGVLAAPSPIFIALIAPEDSGWMQAGWAFLFVTVPLGLLLISVSVTLTTINGIRGLIGGQARLASSLALVGSVGCALSLAILVSLLIFGTDTPSELLLGLIGASAVLLVLGTAAGFVSSRSTPSNPDLA